MIQDLSSKELAKSITAKQTQRVQELIARGVVPHLAIVESLGPKRESEVSTYVTGKLNYLGGIGMRASHVVSPAHMLLPVIREHNAESGVHGMILEMPLHIDGADNSRRGQLRREMVTGVLLNSIAPRKSVDGQGSESTHKAGATAAATVRLLDHYGYTVEGKRVLLVGMGNVNSGVERIVRERQVEELWALDPKLENMDELPARARRAHIVVVATSVENSFTPDLVYPGQAIVGVGAHDLHPDIYAIKDFDFAVTPPIGGVGPLTMRELTNRTLGEAEMQLPYAA